MFMKEVFYCRETLYIIEMGHGKEWEVKDYNPALAIDPTPILY